MHGSAPAGFTPNRRLFRAPARASPNPRPACVERLVVSDLGYFWNMLTFIIILLVVGLIAGAIARLLVPGRDPMGLLGTVALGVVGSFVGGFLQNLVFLHSVSLFALHPSGIIGSIIGSIIVLLVSRIFGGKRRRRA